MISSSYYSKNETTLPQKGVQTNDISRLREGSKTLALSLKK